MLDKPQMGCDPEVFLASQKGTLIPAFQVLPDKKASPSLFWDGFQAEFTTTSHCCLQLLADQIQRALLNLALTTQKSLDKIALLEGDVVEIKEFVKRVDPKYLQLGCDPSFNLYGMTGQIPADPRKLLLRFAGGHIHFGHSFLQKDHKLCGKVVANLDKVLGIWSIGAAANYDKTKLRRKFYGLAGEFRLPAHGLEYRTLSNFWLKSPELFYITFEIARAIMRAADTNILDFWNAEQQLVIDTINNYDVVMARNILRSNEKQFLDLLQNYSPFGREEDRPLRKKALQVGLEGIEVVTTKTIEQNWHLPEAIKTGVNTLWTKETGAMYLTWRNFATKE